MRFRRPAKPNVAINIAPLVDVVFLLVIFFAVSTTFLETAGLKLELPESGSTVEKNPKQLTVFLATDGSLSFDGERLELAQLRERLEAALDGVADPRVTLRADAGSRHGDVVRVMDVIRESGAKALTVAARKAEAAP